MHKWWMSLPAEAKAAVIGGIAGAIAATILAAIGWIVAYGIPHAIRSRRERHLQACRNAVADVLRAQRDLGLTQERLTSQVNQYRAADIEAAIRYFEEKGLIRFANGERWVWLSSRVWER